MCSVTEKPASNEPQPEVDKAASPNDFRPSPRRRKETLLPEITQLALDGLCGQAIGRKLGLSKRTVNRWLQALRQEWIASATEDAAAKMALALARLDAIYREAMGEWRESRPDREARPVDDTELAGGDAKKRSAGTQPKGRNAALLARATAAVAASCRLMGRVAPPPTAAPDEPISSAPPAEDDSDPIADAETVEQHKMWLGFIGEEELRVMNRDDLREVAWRLRTVIRAVGGVIPAALKDRDLGYMTRYELRIHRVRLMAAIEAFHDAEGAKLEASSPPDVESSPPAAESSRPNSPSEQHEV